MNSLAVKKDHVLLGLLLVVLAILPKFLPSYPLYVMAFVLWTIFMAQAWNISAGFAGSFSFVHPVFMGVGAYTSTLLFIHLGITPWIGMFAGAALSIAVAIPITYVAVRAKLEALAFSMFTLAFVVIVGYAADSFKLFGGSDQGVQVPYRPGLVNMQFQSKAGYYYVILAMTVSLMVFCWRLLQSALGLRFKAIADNVQAAEAVGVDQTKYALIATGISAFFFSLGGSFYAQFVGSLFTTTAIDVVSLLVVILVVAVGGLGTLWGPVVGTAIVVPIGEILRVKLPQYQSLYLLMYGVIVVAILIFAPRGLLRIRKKGTQGQLKSEEPVDIKHQGPHASTKSF